MSLLRTSSVEMVGAVVVAVAAVLVDDIVADENVRLEQRDTGSDIYCAQLLPFGMLNRVGG